MTQSNVQQVVIKYRDEQGASLRGFAQAVGVSHEAVRGWETGAHKPQMLSLLHLAMKNQDWRETFALDCLAAMVPELYSPVGAIGRQVLGDNGKE